MPAGNRPGAPSLGAPRGSRARAEGPPRTTRPDLARWARDHMPDREMIVVSNREPYSHQRLRGGIRAVRNAGGLTVALDAVMQALGGVWVAHGSGNADRDVVDAADRVACPPGTPRYQLRRLWIESDEYAGYYSGFANSALWPLCHVAYVRPRFVRGDWEHYVTVNRRFAEAVLAEAGERPALVFIQDYHLALAAQTIKEARPDLQVAMFWHIPWPNPEAFRVLPWGAELLEGMLACDVLGFHIRRHALNFLDCVSETLEARVDLERMAVDRRARRTWVRAFPISVDAVPSLREYKAKYAMSVDLASDFRREVCQAYGTFNPSRFYSNRAYFLVDRDGIIRWRHVEVKNGDRRENSELLAAIDALTG